MKRMLFFCSLAVTVWACSNSEVQVKSSTAEGAVNLPYTAAYTTHWSKDVSDADLKTVLDSYKAWETNDMTGLAATLADSIEVEMSNGDRFKKTRDELIKLWASYRDSLSSVSIKMDSWDKMYATDFKDGYIVVWYDETDHFKDGRIDSASYHDINQVKNGKIVWYSQYKRPKK